MNYLLRNTVITGTIILAGLFVAVEAQVVTRQKCFPETSDLAKTSETWRVVDLKELTVTLPETFVQVPISCKEGGCYRFESGAMVFRIDLNSDAGRPSFERNDASYCEWFLEIDSRKAWLWSFTDSGKYKYLYGVNFNLLNRKIYDVGFYLSSENKAVQDLATQIFKSIKFKEPVKVH